MGRRPCCDKIGLKKGPWTMEEDHKLMNFILNNGIQCWRLVPKLAGLMRCGKSCRLRWINYLRPDVKRGSLTEAEEDMIIQLHSCYGNRWSKIASHFPGRTDNEIKNQWNTKIKKKLKHLGLDSVTHEPISKPNIIAKDEEENIQSSSSENQKNKTSEPGLGEKNDYFHDNEMWENLSTSKTRPSNEFSHGINGQSFPLETEASLCTSDPFRHYNIGDFSTGFSISGQSSDDFLPQWIDTPSNMLSWDNLNSFSEFLYDIHPCLDGTDLY